MIQPMTAVLRCAALHLPARAAKFLGFKSLSPTGRLSTVANGPTCGAPRWGGLQASGAGGFGGWAGGWLPAAGGCPHYDRGAPPSRRPRSRRGEPGDRVGPDRMVVGRV